MTGGIARSQETVRKASHTFDYPFLRQKLTFTKKYGYILREFQVESHNQGRWNSGVACLNCDRVGRQAVIICHSPSPIKASPSARIPGAVVMSGLINFIKSLFSGILGLFSKKKESSGEAPKLNTKKSSGYFLEAEDTAATSSQTAPAAPAATSPTPAASEEKKPSKRAAQLAAAKAETAKATPAKPAATAKAAEPVAVAQAFNLPKPTVTTFAPDYLLPTSTNGRRRPGANMASFLDMAKQIKVPNRA